MVNSHSMQKFPFVTAASESHTILLLKFLNMKTFVLAEHLQISNQFAVGGKALLFCFQDEEDSV